MMFPEFPFGVPVDINLNGRLERLRNFSWKVIYQVPVVVSYCFVYLGYLWMAEWLEIAESVKAMLSFQASPWHCCWC